MGHALVRWNHNFLGPVRIREQFPNDHFASEEAINDVIVVVVSGKAWQELRVLIAEALLAWKFGFTQLRESVKQGWTDTGNKLLCFLHGFGGNRFDTGVWHPLNIIELII